MKMTMRQFAAVAVLGLLVSGSMLAGLGLGGPVALQQVQAADGEKKDAPLSRDELLKQGAVALEKNCTACHLADKWEGTNRDREGWAAIVHEMDKLMDDAKMPKMNEKTVNLIIDYLTLTRPQ